MTERIRQSVSTLELGHYYQCGWAYIMPDFDKPNHSWVEWLSDSIPVYPSNTIRPNEEQKHDHANDRRQQPA